MNETKTLCSGVFVWTNQRPLSRSRDHSRPIRGQHSILFAGWWWLGGEKALWCQKKWSRRQEKHLIIHGLKIREHSLVRPIRGKYSGHVITLGQSEDSIQVTWSLSTNRDQSTQMIAGLQKQIFRIDVRSQNQQEMLAVDKMSSYPNFLNTDPVFCVKFNIWAEQNQRTLDSGKNKGF